MPPTYQNTDGTPHSVPKDPKSSLAETGVGELVHAVLAEMAAQRGGDAASCARGR